MRTKYETNQLKDAFDVIDDALLDMDTNDMARVQRDNIREIEARVIDLLVEKSALELENEQLRRTVEDLRQQLKTPPY